MRILFTLWWLFESRTGRAALKFRVDICRAHVCGPTCLGASLLQCGREMQVVATVTNVFDSVVLFHPFISRRSFLFVFPFSYSAREELPLIRLSQEK